MRISASVICAISAAGILLLFTPRNAALQVNKGNGAPPAMTSDCRRCHECDAPNAVDPCLKECPRPTRVAGTPVPADKSPDTVILSELSDLYVPVVFAHKLHAEMSSVGGGCTLCHHHTPTEQSHPPCKACHQPGPAKGDLQQPGLKGAYHRQCMGCHREWSHDTECSVCHAKKAGGPLAPTVKDQSDIVGASHPILTEPVTRVFQTKYDGGTLVTFHHREHIHTFGLACADCHKKESCSRCHDVGNPTKTTKTFTEHHQPCFSCHEGDDCTRCHQSKERPVFTHDSVGWPLNRFHKDLECRSCHTTGTRFTKLDPTCTSCHKDWQPGTFKHQVTGVTLGGCHSDLECIDCHNDPTFKKKPTCNGCHDDGRSYNAGPLCSSNVPSGRP